MRTYILGWLMLTMLAVSMGCDVIEGPTRVAPSTQVPTDTTARKRIVLIEEFTGHQCGNCPTGADRAKALYALYPDQVVLVAVHAGFFARTNVKYTTDYTTPTGNELDQFYGVSAAGNPNGMVNRSLWAGQRIVAPDAWGSALTHQLAQPLEAWITLQPNYNPTNRQLQLAATVEYAQMGAQDDRLVVYLIEDNLVSLQKDYRLPSPSDVPDYQHQHVLRAALNGTWGEALAAGGPVPSPATRLSRNYTYTLPSGWDPANCKVVAFVYSASAGGVRQAAKVPVMGN